MGKTLACVLLGWPESSCGFFRNITISGNTRTNFWPTQHKAVLVLSRVGPRSMLCVLKRPLFPSSKWPLSPLDQGAFASGYFIPFAHTAFPAGERDFQGPSKAGDQFSRLVHEAQCQSLLPPTALWLVGDWRAEGQWCLLCLLGPPSPGGRARGLPQTRAG